MKEQFPPEKHGRIINAHLESGQVEISATDWMAFPGFAPKLGNMSALFITCTDGVELKAVFDKLAVGAAQEGTMAEFRVDSVSTRERPLRLEVQGETTSGVVEAGMSLIVPLAPDADVATVLTIAAVRHLDAAGADDRHLVLLVPASPIEAESWTGLFTAGTVVHAAHFDPAA